MINYKTIQGDTWDIIAKKNYDDERLMTVLLDANPEYIEYMIFPAGCEIKIPEVDNSVYESLPPWVD